MTLATNFVTSLLLIAMISNQATSKVHVIKKQSDITSITGRPMQQNSSVAVTKRYPYKNYYCLYVRGQRMPRRKMELKCCNLVKKRFYRNWLVGRDYLTTFLDTLKQWECPELERQCKNRFFDFTAFTSVVYMRVCQPEKYHSHCFDKVSKVASTYTNKTALEFSSSNITESGWQNMVHGLNSKDMTDEELGDPCAQVALYEGGRGGPGRFHESIDFSIPFCGVVWCGYDADTLYGRKISLWTCMPQGCRVGMAISFVIVGCLGLATLAANILIIAVYWYKKQMNSSQIVYKVTLAIGDVMVGAVVFPTFISTFFMQFSSRHFMGDFLEPIKNESLEGTGLEPRRMPSGQLHRSFPASYLDAVGFFTSLSIFLSLYTLMLASFDRMTAVCRPMAYDRRTALHFAKYSCAVLGLLGLIVATLPIYASTLRYDLVASILVALAGEPALIIYTVVFLLPLILVWISSITLFIYSKKHTEVRRRISSVSEMQVSETERRLAKTLGIMVGVFTATILPALAATIAPFFTDKVYYSLPEKLNSSSANATISAEFVSVVILSSNSLWNFFIYGSRDKDFGPTARSLVKAVFRKICILPGRRKIKHVYHRRSTATSLTSNSTAVFTAKSHTSVSSDNEINSGVLKSASASCEDRQEKEIPRTGEENAACDAIVNENATWRSFGVHEKSVKDLTEPTAIFSLE